MKERSKKKWKTIQIENVSKKFPPVLATLNWENVKIIEWHPSNLQTFLHNFKTIFFVYDCETVGKKETQICCIRVLSCWTNKSLMDLISSQFKPLFCVKSVVFYLPTHNTISGQPFWRQQWTLLKCLLIQIRGAERR